MSFINVAQANTIIAAAVAKGIESGMKPLTVAVVDASGALICFQRNDGAPPLRPAVAIGKAAGAVGFGVSSRRLGEMAVERPHFVSAVGNLAPHGLVPVAGGVNIVDGEGHIIGAVGVSGDTSDNDEICALAGISAAGLQAQG
jgi:uncharacterized protein GlcG (DUF336 family)